MATSIKAKDLPEKVARKAAKQAKKAADTALKQPFEGKTFASLDEAEKDDLLKNMAIMLGLIEE